MRVDDIRALVRKQPFRPMRVFVSGGFHYDVLHHDFMLVGRTEVVIGLASGPDDFPDQKAYVDPLHITRIEPLNGKRNGQAAT